MLEDRIKIFAIDTVCSWDVYCAVDWCVEDYQLARRTMPTSSADLERKILITYLITLWKVRLIDVGQ